MQCPRYAHISTAFGSILHGHTKLLLVLTTASPIAMGAFVTRPFTHKLDASRAARGHDACTDDP